MGLYSEGLINIVKKGRQGAEEIKQMMMDFRNKPVERLASSKVILIKDYQEQTAWDLLKNEKYPMVDIPKSNVLIYYTEDGSKIAIRPSGTEPKIKFYISVQGIVNDTDNFNEEMAVLSKKMEIIKHDLGL